MVNLPKLNYHYRPLACWGGNRHMWVDTGVVRQIYTGNSTSFSKPKEVPKEKEQRCFCGATQWVIDAPTGLN